MHSPSRRKTVSGARIYIYIFERISIAGKPRTDHQRYNTLLFLDAHKSRQFSRLSTRKISRLLFLSDSPSLVLSISHLAATSDERRATSDERRATSDEQPTSRFVTSLCCSARTFESERCLYRNGRGGDNRREETSEESAYEPPRPFARALETRNHRGETLYCIYKSSSLLYRSK